LPFTSHPQVRLPSSPLFFSSLTPLPKEQAAGALPFLFYFKVCLVVCFVFPKFLNFRHLVKFYKVGNFGDIFLSSVDS
jgi:hypothetical protein